MQTSSAPEALNEPHDNRKHRASNYDLEARLLEYSVRVIRLAEKLPATRSGNHIAGQLLRSGTSPLANHGEAQAAESKNDFIHKMRLSLKELRESYRWLLLIHNVPLVTPAKVEPLIAETDELIRIFVRSIQTAERKDRQIAGSNGRKQP